jgi:uncharacterized protein (UPF0335 family)
MGLMTSRGWATISRAMLSGMDSAGLEFALGEIEQHIADCDRYFMWQCELVAEKESRGLDVSILRQILRSLEKTQRLYFAYRDTLLREINLNTHRT